MFCNNQVGLQILTPNENLFGYLKIIIENRAPTNINSLMTICQEDWDKMPLNVWGKSVVDACRYRLVVVEPNKVKIR